MARAGHPRRWIVFGLAAIVFFFVALSSDLYNITSPPALSLHIVLRKAYSIVAFAVVGASFVWASGASPRGAGLAIAVYSGGIEVAQHFVDHSLEGYYWNAFDVVCGAIGGVLGALIPWVRAR